MAIRKNTMISDASEVTYSVVENYGWDARDKKQRKVGTITQLQFIDLKAEEAGKLSRAALLEELNSERQHPKVGSERQTDDTFLKSGRVIGEWLEYPHNRIVSNPPFSTRNPFSSSKDDI